MAVSDYRTEPLPETEITEKQLLRSVVEVACAAFCASAASVLLVDQDSGELVFETVSGEGEAHLVGARLPAGTGIAGWVVGCGQPTLVDDLANSSRFSRPAAESTGYVPRSIMAAPLVRSEECVGVLEVLDRGTGRDELRDLTLLGLLATQAALGLDLLLRTQRPAWTAGADDGLVARIARRLPRAESPLADAALSLLAGADRLLTEVD